MSEELTVKKIDGGVERLICVGMVISDSFLKDIQLIYSHEYIAFPFAKTVATWCLDYYKQYQKAPGIHIKDIYEAKVREGLVPEQAELIGLFLESISNEYERSGQFNSDYIMQQAEKHFKQRSLKALSEDIVTLISQGQAQEAEELLTQYKRIERPQSGGINPFTDREAIYKAIEKRQENILYKIPGALGEFLGPVERSTLTGIMAPEKRGKTWILMQNGIWAYQQQCNVAFFEIGDMVEQDIVRRVCTNITRTTTKNVGEIKIPILDCLHNQLSTCTKKERCCDFGVLHRKRSSGSEEEYDKTPLEAAPSYKPCTVCNNGGHPPGEFKGAVWHKMDIVTQLNWKQSWEAGKKTAKRAGSADFKLVCLPNSSLSVRGIESQLDMWEQTEAFVPDVVIIDYADNLSPMDPKRDERHRQTDNWKALRALSQKYFCNVLTATQADAASYDKESLDESNFSESKGKYGQVNVIWTLNQTPEEKKEGVIRFGQMFRREDEYDTKKHCTVMQCLSIGRPYMGSYL
jgi:hypothetical protein